MSSRTPAACSASRTAGTARSFAACSQQRLPHRDSLDDPLVRPDADLIPRLEGVAQQEQDPGEQVLQDVLEGEADRRWPRAGPHPGLRARCRGRRRRGCDWVARPGPAGAGPAVAATGRGPAPPSPEGGRPAAARRARWCAAGRSLAVPRRSRPAPQPHPRRAAVRVEQVVDVVRGEQLVGIAAPVRAQNQVAAGRQPGGGVAPLSGRQAPPGRGKDLRESGGPAERPVVNRQHGVSLPARVTLLPDVPVTKERTRPRQARRRRRRRRRTDTWSRTRT